MMNNIFIAAVVTIALISSLSVYASSEYAEQSTQPMKVQEEEPVPFDQWYGPDDTLDIVDDDVPDSVVIPEGPVTDERVAPEEDPRPNAR